MLEVAPEDNARDSLADEIKRTFCVDSNPEQKDAVKQASNFLSNEHMLSHREKSRVFKREKDGFKEMSWCGTNTGWFKIWNRNRNSKV